MLLENLMSEKEVKTKECKEAQECEEAQDQGGARTKFGSCCFSRYVIMIVQCSWNTKIVYQMQHKCPHQFFGSMTCF